MAAAAAAAGDEVDMELAIEHGREMGTIETGGGTTIDVGTGIHGTAGCRGGGFKPSSGDICQNKQNIKYIYYTCYTKQSTL